MAMSRRERRMWIAEINRIHEETGRAMKSKGRKR